MFPKEEKKVVVDEMEVKGTSSDELGTTMMTSADDQRGIWEIDVKAQQQNLLHEMNDSSSMFYNDQFPTIPDFPCMSSSSSSSSNPAPRKPMSSACTTSSTSYASSTSSASSWAVLKSEYVTEEEGEVPLVAPQLETAADGSGSINCMDVMETFGYMDLIDGNEIWDPSSIFEEDPGFQGQDGTCFNGRGNSNGSEVVQEGEMMESGKLDDLGVMFFDWLKSNKEVISAEDMRNIKLKRSTIECASKRLGSSKEGKKQLLKLILEWVQQNQLQRKNSGGVGAGAVGEFSATDATITSATQYPLQQYQGLPLAPPQAPIATSPTQPPPFNCNTWVPPSDMWIPPTVGYPSYMTDQTANGMALVGSVPPQTPYPYTGGGGDHYMNPYNNQFLDVESAPSWNPSQITMAGSPYNNQFLDVGNNYGPQVIMPLAPGYPDQYQYNPQVYAPGGGGSEQRVMRLGSSATKEARKKRMARQRKTYFNHHHHSRQNQHNCMVSGDHHQHAQAMLVDDNCSGKSHGGNWLYWPSPPSATTLPPPPMEASHRSSARPQQSENRVVKQTSSSDKRQGLKTEKNLKFLLQKVLKQSDVGSLGRIVLPKKEAESHLPDLESRDGISIAMEDIGTSQVWNMRYRFWPNNKSRMYLLENTGDFVKVNGLQEGDFIVLYSDVKCGKYLIRGVKVRQSASGKLESKKPVKRSYRSTTQPGRSSSSPPANITAI